MSKFLGGVVLRTDGAILRIAGALVAEYSPLPGEIDIAFMFAYRSTRKTDNGGAISYKGHSYVPRVAEGTETMARVTVEVREMLDGRIYIIHKKKRIEMQEMVRPQRANEATKEVNAKGYKSAMVPIQSPLDFCR